MGKWSKNKVLLSYNTHDLDTDGEVQSKVWKKWGVPVDLIMSYEPGQSLTRSYVQLVAQIQNSRFDLICSRMKEMAARVRSVEVERDEEVGVLQNEVVSLKEEVKELQGRVAGLGGAAGGSGGKTGGANTNDSKKQGDRGGATTTNSRGNSLFSEVEERRIKGNWILVHLGRFDVHVLVDINSFQWFWVSEMLREYK